MKASPVGHYSINGTKLCLRVVIDMEMRLNKSKIVHPFTVGYTVLLADSMFEKSVHRKSKLDINQIPSNKTQRVQSSGTVDGFTLLEKLDLLEQSSLKLARVSGAMKGQHFFKN